MTPHDLSIAFQIYNAASCAIWPGRSGPHFAQATLDSFSVPRIHSYASGAGGRALATSTLPSAMRHKCGGHIERPAGG